MPDVTVRYALSGDVHIAFQTLGQGPVDLLMFTGDTNISIDSMDDEPSLARFHRRLASFSRLIRFDCRGVGLSDPVLPSNPPTLEEWAQDALAVLDAVRSESAALYSTGGRDAILLAATHPERVSHLITFNGSARVIRDDDYPFGIPRHVVDRYIETVTQSDAIEQGVDDVGMMNPSAAGDRAFRAWWDRAGRRGASPAMAQAIHRTRWYSDVRALLPLIQVPTLVLHRRDFPVLRAEHGRYLAEHIPGAKYVELPGADFVYWVGETETTLAEIEEFLTGARRAPESERVLATVLFTDIVDSTAQATVLGDRGWGDRLDRHDAMVRRQLERFRGREIKTTGDGFLAMFDGPARAIQCGLAIRDGASQLDIDVRIGLHTGEVELRGNDIAGVSVNIGARVAALASGGEVLVSRTVTDLVAGSGMEFEDRGESELKGVPGLWRLFAVRG